jgi:hypothetical protein
MTNPTSNFGWQMPTPTDLVTDLPADFEVFGQAVDTSMADLKGGTTGQILSKATNTDMDFTWITNDVGDITAITVTAPITGGGTSGSVGIAISGATTSASGAVQLSDSTSTTSSVLAATPTAVKAAYDLAAAAIPKVSTYTAKTDNYTFANGDAYNMFSMNNAVTKQFSIPTDATHNFGIGTEINVFWITGAGQPTIGAVTPGTTTVISTGATSATPKLRVANSGATCKKIAANSWIVFGDIV